MIYAKKTDARTNTKRNSRKLRVLFDEVVKLFLTKKKLSRDRNQLKINTLQKHMQVFSKNHKTPYLFTTKKSDTI